MPLIFFLCLSFLFVLCIKTVPQMSFVMITLIGSSRRMCLNRSAVRSGNILRVTSVVARERDFTDLPRAHVFLCFNFFVLTSSPRYLVFCAMRRNCVPRVRRGEEKKKKTSRGWVDMGCNSRGGFRAHIGLLPLHEPLGEIV